MAREFKSWRLLLLAAFFLGTLVLMIWFVHSNVARSRAERNEIESRKAQQNAPPVAEPREKAPVSTPTPAN